VTASKLPVTPAVVSASKVELDSVEPVAADATSPPPPPSTRVAAAQASKIFNLI